MRGENSSYSNMSDGLKETPPLARRKPAKMDVNQIATRNTSACAEKTTPLVFLHVETPPLARRKHCFSKSSIFMLGNTSACAEKTERAQLRTCPKKKHLRLRGENGEHRQQCHQEAETPPLARRKLIYGQAKGFRNRNTSACAEKTKTS